MQDPDDPDPEYLKEIVDVFFRDVETRLNVDILLKEHEEVDYGKMSSPSESPPRALFITKFYVIFWLLSATFAGNIISLRTLVMTCDAFITCYHAANFERCVECLRHLKDDYYVIKRKPGTLLQLENQILAAGGTYPIIEYYREKTKRTLIPKRQRVYGD
ncbi:histidine-containing phosphotransfer protein 1-like [Apium graveolens]|uniref:histidine-containing phosphotransfer protein 1-like n=1 Tax=Apium graveolens TaxID=4045 RepID=UPI003D79610D